MFDASGNRATTFGLKITMYSMLAIVAAKLVQFMLDFMRERELLPVIGDVSVAQVLSLMIVVPLMLLAVAGAMAGSWLGFKGVRHAWARQFAIGALAAFTVTELMRLAGLAISFTALETDVINSESFSAKATGLLLVGIGIYLYYLLALDAGDDFPGGLGLRGGRMLLAPLVPILVGGFIAWNGEHMQLNASVWIVVVAAGLTALSAYNRIPPDDAIMEPMPQEKPPMPPVV